jgi:branched-chain amino acid transport system ATP-binding protein
VLKIDEIDVFYGNIRALTKVSLEVPQGSIVTIIGANGAGKSTLLKTISGLLKPATGQIYFHENRIDRMPAHQIVQLGIAHCPEGRRLWPNMSVLENLEMGAHVRSLGKAVQEDIEKVYEYFPILAKRQKQLAGSLSGGEQQMLAIGRAIMANPKLLLLDEPSLGLAPIIVDQMAEIILEIHRNGTTILLVEQNAFLALNMADQGYVLEVGKVVLSNTAKSLLDNDFVRKAYLGL